MNNLINKVAENLTKNNMEAFVVDKKDEILPLLKTLMPSGASVGVGGSATLDELGVIPFLREGDYAFFDRYAEGLTRPEAVEVMRQSLLADVFLTSSNAVTEKGELYNVDGRSNRVAPLLFGPDSVVVVAGINKIVANIDEAVHRHKTVAAPANSARLRCNNPCVRTGKCVSLMRQTDEEMCAGCASEDRICANYVISARQREAGRIKVILVGETLGF